MSDTELRQKIAQLQSQVTSLEQLLEVHERTAVEQSERLERAMAELHQAKLQSEFQVAPLEQLLEVHERTTIEQAEQLEQTMAALQIAKLQSEERLHTVITNVPVVIFALDRHGIFTLSEGKGLAALGLQPGQVVGQSAFDVYQDEPPLISEVKRALAGEAFSSTVEMGTLALETWYTPLRDQYGEPAGTIGVAMNITERKRLERQIQESLERRGRQVQTSTEIAQEIAAAPALNELFRRVVTLVKERFGYYHTQIFRYEPALDAVVLVTGYGEVGQKMLAAGHKLAVGRGVVGTAADTGSPVLAIDVTQDKDWRPNPDLPDTKGELAVPIKLRDQVLGILDVQSDRVGALTAEDQLLLEGLCGQIAVAMESTRAEQVLRANEAQMQETLRELERLNRAATREGWRAFLQTGQLAPAYRYDRTAVQPAQELWMPQIEQAIQQNTLVPPSEENTAAVAPLSVRGAAIGALGVYDDPNHPLSPDELALLQEIVEQGSLALENARLYQDAQRRAAQERLTGEITARMRETLDMDAVLKTAVREMGEALKLHDLTIQLEAHGDRAE